MPVKASPFTHATSNIPASAETNHVAYHNNQAASFSYLGIDAQYPCAVSQATQSALTNDVVSLIDALVVNQTSLSPLPNNPELPRLQSLDSVEESERHSSTFGTLCSNTSVTTTIATSSTSVTAKIALVNDVSPHVRPVFSANKPDSTNRVMSGGVSLGDPPITNCHYVTMFLNLT